MSKILLIVAINILLFGCASDGEGYMQQDELLTQINKGQPPVIVDVRSTFEYESGHVPGAIHIPFWTTLTSDLLDGYEKNQRLILYCEHGPRAGIARLALSLSGFDKISYLSGHMTGWKKSGLPIEVAKIKK